MTTPYDPYSAVPSPERNRAEWVAQNPGAVPVDPRSASEAVARNLAGGAPASGVTDSDLGAQAAAAGARAGVVPNDGTLPAEQQHDDEMARMKAMFNDMALRVQAMEDQRRLEHQAHIAALGEPILERYAKGVRDKLKTHAAMHPGLADHGHFAGVIQSAEKLVTEASRTIEAGANDVRGVQGLGADIERFVEKTHPRTAGGNHRHVDFSSVLYDLEMMLEEAARLAPAAAGILARL